LLSPYLEGLTLRMYPAEEGFSVRLRDGEAVLLAAGRSEATRALCLLASAVQNGMDTCFFEQRTPFVTRGVCTIARAIPCPGWKR
jgi:hypothetical protein